MPTFVYMTRCDGCGQCVDICPSDIMHIDTVTRRAYNIEPNMCWECYSCVKACPEGAITLVGKKKPVKLDQAKCIKCGACYDVCPVDAVTVR